MKIMMEEVMEFMLIGLVVALTVARSMRNSHERNTRIDGYYVSTSYRAKTARAHGWRS